MKVKVLRKKDGAVIYTNLVVGSIVEVEEFDPLRYTVLRKDKKGNVHRSLPIFKYMFKKVK